MSKSMENYDDICANVRKDAQADGAIVIIVNGNQGSGFSCQGPEALTKELPNILEGLAKQIRMSQPA
jgi:molybdopterin biosynthesis enzyme MoaB